MTQRLAILVAAVVVGGISAMVISSRDEGGSARVDLAYATLPQPTAQQQAGRTLFDANCATCHGESAAGSDRGPPLVHRIYEPGHHGDMAFLIAARQGVRAHHWRFGNMPPVDGVTEADVVKITAYVRALQRANGIN
ncbi:c-type cytochrome [Oceanibium sediminis]|uniref:c-type cytochrome n=1 Tax=Oceanibium sediminis TaxID=2026339 RepID=UPI000DD33E05|nr:cytochrome c [Oceanibium sediminis]